jgi:glycerol transport system permease protein
MRLRYLVPFFYILFLMLPIYWFLWLSFKTTNEILGTLPCGPELHPENYAKIFTDPTWVLGYINSLIYVLINTALVSSRRRPPAFHATGSLGDKHLFFWFVQPDGSALGFALHSFSSIRP